MCTSMTWRTCESEKTFVNKADVDLSLDNQKEVALSGQESSLARSDAAARTASERCDRRLFLRFLISRRSPAGARRVEKLIE
jgi:hypothetical protein